jgi:rhodanese-related sulfurtransferase/nitrous oxidase accessory protein NosD
MAEKAFFLALFASLLILSFSPLIVKPTLAQQIYIDVTVSQAKVMIDTNPSLVILDVRNQSEYDAGHIRNAKLIPVWNLTQNLDKLNQTDEILVYCKGGARSTNASNILASNGFLHVYNMLEGINGWRAPGYPVYVNYSSTYANFPSIQAAIDNTTEGQTIYVGKGFYNERLFLSKPLTLVGENASMTIINETATVLNVDTDNVSISDFTVQYTGCACFGYSSINVTNSQSVNVTNNIIISDDFGIRVVAVRNVIVADNDVTHTGNAAIVVLDSKKVSVFKNNVTAMRGIQIENCTEGSFSSNTILSNETGIFIAQSYDDTFFGNNVSSINSMGLSISSCYNNSFFDNDISSNNSYGLFIWQSYDNSIFDNNFPGNGSQVLCYDNSTNIWDNGLEGNFWSNYTGVDTDLNGIGDTPYVIDSTNRDNHPLMGLFQSFNTSLNCNVNIVSNSSVSEFEYSAPNRTITLLVSNTTADQTAGFCRISIPHSLIDPYNGSISVVIDNGQTPVLFLNNTLYDNGTNRWIYFTYQLTTHSVSVISIVSEFQIFLILALFMIATIITTAMYKKKQAR